MRCYISVIYEPQTFIWTGIIPLTTEAATFRSIQKENGLREPSDLGEVSHIFFCTSRECQSFTLKYSAAQKIKNVIFYASHFAIIVSEG